MRRYINIIALLAIIILTGCKREDDLIPVAKISFKDTYTAEFTSVTLNCEVKSNVTIETLNVEYSTSKDMAESQQVEMSLIKDNTYSATISNLSIQTEYYYRFVVGNKVSEFFDDQKRTFKTLNYTAPVVSTEDATNISGTKATLIGVVEFACEKPILEQGFMVGTEEDKLEAFKVDGSDFTFNIENLNYKTTYYYRAYAKNDIGTGLGKIKTFQTCGAVSFNEIKLSSITANSVMVETGVADNGGIEVDLQGIRYCIKGNDEVSFVETNGAITISNLKHDTTYEVWGYAKTFEGEFEGNRVEFNTLDGKVLITTSSPANVTTSSATLKGNITSDGGSKITERGFCYSTRDIPTLSDIKIKVTGETGTFESELTNLPQNVLYNVRAYAINAIDTYYGEVVSFTTLYDSATFGTLTTSDITASSASLKCSITSNGGSTITKCGFCYSTYKNPTIDDQVAVVSDSKTNLNATIKGLKSGITYYVRAFATNANSTFYSDEISFITSEGIIQFTDPSTDNIAAASFIVSSNILTAGGGTITERGFCYNIAKNPTIENKIVKSSGTLGEYSATITDLQNKTTYYIRAYAINESGTYYSKEITVKTLDGVASLTTSDATDVKAQSATLNGNITSDGGSNITERGFCYSTSDNPTVDDSTIKIKGTTGEISYSLSGLNHATKYYVRSFAKNGYGTHYGNQISFTTSTGIATFDDIAISNVTISSATISSKVLSDGNSTISQRGYCYSINSNPSISDNKVIISGTTGELVGNVTGLINGQKYYVKTFVVNSVGTHYGKETSFTTLTGLAEVTTLPVTNLRAESVTLNGDVESANGGSISSRGFCYSTSPNPTIADSKVTVSGTTGTMTKIVNAVTPDTQYYARAYATTQFGTTYGEEVSFNTKKGIVTFSGFEAQSIKASSAYVSITVENDGGSDILERGYCYSTQSNVSIEDNKVVAGNEGVRYDCLLSNLMRGTTYYIKGYAKNNVGVHYSKEIQIQTLSGIPELTTLKYTNIGQTTISLSCNVSNDGGTDILSRGFCYATSSNPTMESNTVVISGGIGELNGTISNLMSDEKYYIRAFTKTTYGITYSNEVCAKTIAGIATLGPTNIYEIKPKSAIFKSSLLSSGGTDILSMGFCYSTHNNPSINDNVVSADSYLSEFSGKVENLLQNTTYYVRSYATTQYGTTYSELNSFTTTYYPVTFNETEINNILLRTATANCSVLSDGENGIEECGFCYSTRTMPTTEDQISIANISGDTFSITVKALKPSTKYYLRPYAKNVMGTFYGNEVVFSTVSVPDGSAPGIFKLSNDGNYAFLASGDLEKDANEIWHFAENQLNNTENYTNTFTRGSSGYSKSGVSIDEIGSLTDDYANYDWGVYNPIDNGGNTKGLWRTPSIYEWQYILRDRPNAANMRCYATVDDIKGMIVLPDDWETPIELIHLYNNNEFITTTFTASEWAIMENLGAIFFKTETLYYPYGPKGWGGHDGSRTATGYWSSTGYYSGSLSGDIRGGYIFSFTNNVLYYDSTYSSTKVHVRLIQEMK